MSADLSINNDTVQFGTFTLKTQVFGVDLLRMREIIRPVAITRVPHAKEFVDGVINLRGRVIPVISLRARFNMPRKPFDSETRIINIEIGNAIVGFIVDSIGHVHRLPLSSIEPPLAVTSSVDSDYIEGISNTDGQMLIILDVDKLVFAKDLEDFS